jgi:hypothetical protein
MNIEDLTIKQAKELASMFNRSLQTEPFQPFAIGRNYLIRTVTHIDIGTVVAVGPTEIVMVDVAWIADTGRYHDALTNGTLGEVEPYPDDQEVIIGRGAIIDATQWNHPLPREQK